MLERVLSSYANGAYVLLRLVSGLAFAFHGAQKILGFHSSFMPQVGSQLWFGGMIELMGGVLIALGLWTRWAAFLASGTMAVAYIQFHWQGQLDEKFFPALNDGELSLLYCFLFFYVACRGSLGYGIDNKRR
jgi:putative oxidoreductase